MTKPEPQNIYAFGIPSAAIMGTPTVTVRSYLTSQHLWTARREAWLCRRREDELVGTNDANVFYRHHSHAITAVLSAVAFLEAFIKAIWQDAADSKPGQHTPYTDGIPDDAMATMRKQWNGTEQVEGISLLTKFEVALVCARQEPMNTDAEPYQSVDVLIPLRNNLVHFKPQSHPTEQNDIKKLVRQILEKTTQARKNRERIGQQGFPNIALRAECADWACKSTIAFAREWHARMGLTHDFDATYLKSLPPVEIDD
jgi:hypothetical protein